MTGGTKRRHSRRAAVLVVGVSTAVIASLLTVSALTERYSVVGDPVDFEVESLEPMERPEDFEGVKLSPPKPDVVERKAEPPLEAKQTCSTVDKKQVGPVTEQLGLKAGAKVCAMGPTRQSPDLLNAKRFQVVKGSTATRIPRESLRAEPAPEEQAEPDDEEGELLDLEPGLGGDESEPEETGPSETPQVLSDLLSTSPGASSVISALNRAMPKVVPGDPGTFLSPNWIESHPAQSPPERMGAAMAFDAHKDRRNVVLFGGFGQTGVVGDTWIWSAGTWAQATPATSPSARHGASLVWDPTAGGLVLFGGLDSTATRLNDVWLWDGADWTQLSPTGTVPSARAYAAVAYDPQREGLVVFGGQDAGGPSNDTWLLKDNAWTQIQAHGAPGAPPARSNAALAYSESTSQLLLFGGEGSTAPLDDTWVLPPAASAWAAQSPTHVPTARGNAAMVFNPGIDGVTLFGGLSTSAALNDTWAWDGSDWLEAAGIASPPGRLRHALAATDTGQVVAFGGMDGAVNLLDDTWVYDAALPLLEVETEGAAGEIGGHPAFYTGESVTVKITATNVGVIDIEPDSRTTLTSALTDSVLAAGSIMEFGGVEIDRCEGIAAVLCGGVESLTATIANISIGVNQSKVGEFVATVASAFPKCTVLDIPAVVSSIFGGSATASTQITVCGGGLGVEKWWTYDTTDLGGGGTASVNVANGNLVVKQYDSTPVQTRGRLALALGRAYNSQDLMSGGGPIGAGWQFDIGETSEFAGGFGIAGLSLPNLQTVLQPLSMPYIDRDGTRHVFKLRSVGVAAGDLSLPISLTEGGSLAETIETLLGGLPFALFEDEGYSGLCIDQAYTGPPGSNMFLFRFIGVGSAAGCGNPALNDPLTVGWSLVRPDRLRYDFNALGQLLHVTDPAGNVLDYSGHTMYGPTKIAANCEGALCPEITINYNAGGAGSDRHVRVTDSAGRVTSYIVSNDLMPQLLEVWEPGNPLSGKATGSLPSASYTYSSQGQPCTASASGVSSVGQLCSVTDANGATTRFAYEPAPLGPDRILSVTDRRASDGGDGQTRGLTTLYDYDDDAKTVYADMGSPSKLPGCVGTTACQRIRYSEIDEHGRVGEIAEGRSDDVYVRQRAYYWDGSAGTPSCSQPSGQMNHNLCRTIRRAMVSEDPFDPEAATSALRNGVRVPDEVIDHTYGDLGQLLRTKQLVTVPGDEPLVWGDADMAITTYGTHDQYFDANGDQRAFHNVVRGNGQVGSPASQTRYRQAVLDDDPTAYWRFEEASGTTMASETGTNDGTYDAAVLDQPGFIADTRAIGETSGTAATATLDAPFAHGTSPSDSAFTVETWVRAATPDATLSAYFGGTGSSSNYGIVGRGAGGHPWVLLASDIIGGEFIGVLSTVSVADDEWHHVVYTYDGSGDAEGVTIWVDGKATPVSILSDTLDGAFATTDEVRLGTTSTDDARLDEVAVYPEALSGSRIRAHHRTGTGERIEADTLYAVTDQTQVLSPRGNVAEKWGDYLVTHRRDVPADGQIASTNKVTGNGVCPPEADGNTGLLCETDTPASAGVALGDCKTPEQSPPPGSPAIAVTLGHPSTCTTYAYDEYGQRISMRTPKAHESPSDDPEDDLFTYTYYEDGATDLSGTVSAEGWLKAVTDPAGQSVVYAYDAAGNIARTWDRNATQGLDVETDPWDDPTAAPSSEFTDTVAATPVTSDVLSVSNMGIVTVQPDGTVAGAAGNGSVIGTGSTGASPTPSAAKAVTNVVQVEQSATGTLSGCYFTMMRTGSGEVWRTGGSLSTPARVDGLVDIIDIAAGGCHTLALDARGGLWAWGFNTAGQIGDGTTTNRTTPVKVADGVSAIGAGYAHSLAVKTDGSLWTWGANSSGQLGLGDTSNRTSPAEVEDLEGVRAISGGLDASYAITRDGGVWAWGGNAYGQLGLGTTTAHTSPQRIPGLGEGTAAGLTRQVTGSAYGAAALQADGTVRVWGINNAAQLAGTTSDPASSVPAQVPGVDGQVAMAGGWSTWATADQAGEVIVWGSTNAHQLANGTSPATSPPTTAGIDVSPYRLPWRWTRGTRDATGNLTTAVFDRVGHQRQTRPARGHAVHTAAFDTAARFDQVGRPLWTITAANRDVVDKTTRYTYDEYGNNIKTIDASGIATRNAFDTANRIIRHRFTREPDANNELQVEACTATATTANYTADQDGHDICESSTTYDGLDRVVTSTDPNVQVTRTWSDAASRVIRRETPRGTTEHAVVNTRWRYDEDGNVLTVCAPRQFDTTEPNSTLSNCTGTARHGTHTTYDSAGRAAGQMVYRVGLSPATITTSTAYDADGNPISVTDGNGHTTTATFDLQGRRLSMTVPRDGSKSYTTHWSYDAVGNVTAVRAPGSLNIGAGVLGNVTIDGATHGAGNPFVIEDGAQFRNLTLVNGAHATSSDPNGLMVHATETVSICDTCVITMEGKGETGGATTSGAGEAASNPNPGNGGLGGGGSALGSGGGGGGGHRGDGGNGAGTSPGAGGKSSGTSDFSDVGTGYLRGSGGGGGAGGNSLLGSPGKGGNGGGYVRITATKIVVDGTITAAGQDGGSVSTNTAAGGGGGGAGGGIWLAAPTVELADTDVLDVSGGAGGTTPQDRNGGDGAPGYVRIDADTLTNEPEGIDRTRAAMITAYSYDAANRVVDTLEGAQTLQADTTVDAGEFATPDPHGLANTRSRMFYDPEGRVAAILPPQAFSNQSSLTAPNVETARRVDYDLDGRTQTVYSPRYDTSVASVGDGDDGGQGVDQQAGQCATGRTPDAIAGIEAYASGTGVCVSRTDYDPTGRVDRQWLPTSSLADEGYVSYEYTSDGLPVVIEGPDPEGSGRVEVARSMFDPAGRAIEVTDALDGVSKTSYTADGLVRESARQAYEHDNEPMVTPKVSYTYDASGNVRSTTDGLGNATTQSWTTDNLVATVKAPGVSHPTVYAYDRAGNAVSVLSPEQNADGDPALVNEFTHDNRLAATHTPVTGSSFRTVRYGYAPSGAKITAHTARCSSDDVEDCVPSSGDWHSAGWMRFTYGANGRPHDQVGKTSSSITTTYHQHGVPAQIVDPISNITIATGTYLDGSLRTVDDGSLASSYAYDAAGQLTVRIDDPDSGSLNSGNPVTTSYRYNHAGLVDRMKGDVLDNTTEYEHDAAGRVRRTETGDHVNEWDYNPDGTLRRAETIADGDTVAEFFYRYNNNQDITRQAATGAEAYVNTYGYTPARNLSTWSRDSVTTTYGWDRNNNRTSVSVGGVPVASVDYWLDNSIEKVNGPIEPSGGDPDPDLRVYTYDDAGRLTDDECAEYTYDDFDRTKSVEADNTDEDKCGEDVDTRTTTYSYDGLDRQRTSTVSGSSKSGANITTTSLFDGLTTTLAGQIDAVNGARTAPDLLYQLDPSGTAVGYQQFGSSPARTHLGTDGQGNVVNVVTTGNTTACTSMFDPFGGPIDPADNSNDVCTSGSDHDETGNALWYRGNPRDGSTGNYQLGTRTYDPATGTFTTPDTYRVTGANEDLSVGVDPLTANTYTYVNGNPINMLDPSGHFAECAKCPGGEAATAQRVLSQAAAHSGRKVTTAERAAVYVRAARSKLTKIVGALAVRNPAIYSEAYEMSLRAVRQGADYREFLNETTTPEQYWELRYAAERWAEDNPRYSFSGELILPDSSVTCDGYNAATCESIGGTLAAFPGAPAVKGATLGILEQVSRVFKGRSAANAGDDVVRALSATERRTLDDALRPDKLDHIFDPKHNFQPLVQQFGSREAAMEQIVRSIGGPLPQAGRFEIAQNVGGQAVVIRGAVVDGIPRIGTAFTP